ncbi:hypothetical protein HPB52_024214 [Rhipicephalus sanguineus]|uniref:Right handed beta helix domain-containing protein n=1 Tax=Rhipicephalus sanguineus TaxID=34632 RepID=A0A9D4TCL0_RHISA|nr:hypothetical protein HPB52_024214 [Rhipicephalus sanguineus]
MHMGVASNGGARQRPLKHIGLVPSLVPSQKFDGPMRAFQARKASAQPQTSVQFAVEPRLSAPERLSLVRQISGRAPDSEQGRCVSAGVDVLLRSTRHPSRLPLRKVEAYLKDNALAVLPADKEGGFADDAAGRRQLRELQRIIHQTTEAIWACDLSRLRTDFKPRKRHDEKGKSSVHKLEPLQLPPEVTETLSLGPKFAVEPRLSAPERLSLVRQISGRAPDSEQGRCVSAGVDVLLRSTRHPSRLPLRKVEAYLKDNALAVLPADKEGGHGSFDDMEPLNGLAGPEGKESFQRRHEFNELRCSTGVAPCPVFAHAACVVGEQRGKDRASKMSWAPLVIASAAWSAVVASSGPFSCPSLELCSCVDERVDCACPGDEALDLFALFEPDVEYISVRHCGVVHVPPYLVASLSLEEFTLSDIGQLVIRSMAFERVSAVRTMRIRNVRNLTLEHLALHGLRGTELLEMNNVTTAELPPAALAGFTDVQELAIRDSHLGQVHSMALLFAKGKSCRLSHTLLDQAQNGSLVFDSVSTVEVSNCTFGNVSGAPLSATNATEVILRERGSLLLLGGANATSVVFENNRIDVAGTGALAQLSSAKNVTFARNVIRTAKEAALPSGPAVKFANNSFLHKAAGGSVAVYEAAAVINSSLCVGPPPLDGLRMTKSSLLMKASKRDAREKVLARLSGVLRASQKPVRACGGWTVLAVLVALAIPH